MGDDKFLRSIKVVVAFDEQEYLLQFSKQNISLKHYVRLIGKIISNETNLPVKNLNVRLKYLNKNYVDSASTDGSGNFYFSILYFDSRDYTIDINPKYGVLTVANKQYSFDPIAYLKLNTINEDAVNKNDLVYFSNFNLAVKGLNNKTTFVPVLYGTPKYVKTLEYEVTKNNKTTYFKRDIQLRGLDTLEVDIKY